MFESLGYDGKPEVSARKLLSLPLAAAAPPYLDWRASRPSAIWALNPRDPSTFGLPF